LGTVVQGAKLGIELAAGLFYFVSVALYVAVDPIRNQKSFLSLFPAHSRPRIADLMHESAQTLRQWFLTHLIVVVCIGFAYAVGLRLLGNPSWALFGVLASVLEFVPYIGPFTIALGASAVFLSNGQPMHVIWTLILALFIQELEGHVLLPIVMKERINLPPVQLITLAIVMGLWFGILGVFATPPLLAVLRNIYLEVYVKRMDQLKAG
jgi:predicted PurR-regulated permease PerM